MGLLDGLGSAREDTREEPDRSRANPFQDVSVLAKKLIDSGKISRRHASVADDRAIDELEEGSEDEVQAGSPRPQREENRPKRFTVLL